MSQPDDYIIKYLEEKFAGVERRLDRIEDQTTKTNGRVTTLEEKHTTLATRIATYGTIAVLIIPSAISRFL